jgi:hypothetical protein
LLRPAARWFLARLIFDPEDGDDTKNKEELQNMGIYMIHKENWEGKMVRKHESEVETNLALQ